MSIKEKFLSEEDFINVLQLHYKWFLADTLADRFHGKNCSWGSPIFKFPLTVALLAIRVGGI
jgi:hypothetical protein